METRVSLALAVACVALLAFGLTSAGESPGTSAEQGLFPSLFNATRAVWARANDVEPLSHPDEFGQFYFRLVWWTCPLIGFFVFRLGSGQKLGRQVWKPLAIAILFAIPPLAPLLIASFRILGPAGAVAARCIVVLILMIWSIEKAQDSEYSGKTIEASASQS